MAAFHDGEHVRARYRTFADHECRDYSPLYYRLAHAVAEELLLVEFIAGMPEIQPNLFFASVQFLTGPAGMPQSGAELRSLVSEQGEQVAQLMRSRRTQTNEIGRCATLLPALPPGKLALLEVGASAGLCLLLDEFAYDYGDVRLGNDKARITLHCKVTSSRFPKLAMPQVAWRAGLDLAPVDVHDDADVRWLLSCVWADHADRRQRLAAAIELAQQREIDVRHGDLTMSLPLLLAEVPRDAQLVVFHSAVLHYVSPEGRQAFADCLAGESANREVVWISNEGPDVVPEITAQASPVDRRRFLLGRTRFVQGNREDELLAVAHPHGLELEWCGA